MEKEQVRDLLNIEKASREYLYSKNSVAQDRDSDGLFHPSSIGYCSRKIQYHHLGEHPVKKIPSSTMSIFEMGHAVHDMLQSRLTKVLESRFSSLDGYDFLLTVETPINNTPFAVENGIAGSADGLIMIFTKDGDRAVNIIYEAKSISTKGWTKLTSPMIKHRMQASVYAECLEAQYILFEYFCKDNARSKWYLVDIDRAALASAISQMDKVRSATEKLKMVPREGSSYECSDCAYLEVCMPEGVQI